MSGRLCRALPCMTDRLCDSENGEGGEERRGACGPARVQHLVAHGCIGPGNGREYRAIVLQDDGGAKKNSGAAQEKLPDLQRTDSHC